MNASSNFRRFAESAWEFFWLAVCASALWFAAFIFPVGQAMAAASMPDQPTSLLDGVARGLLMISAAVVILAAGYLLERRLFSAIARRRRNAEAARAEAIEAYGDASLLDRRL